MHMAWMREVCGRQADYYYSAGLVYGNFPRSEVATAEQTRQSRRIRPRRPRRPPEPPRQRRNPRRDLYDSLYISAPRLKAHQNLDRAVERCYRKEKFDSEWERVDILFEWYKANSRD